MRQPNTTATEMLSSGQWAKSGKNSYRHVSGVEVVKDGSCWVVTSNNQRYSALWTARIVVEKYS